MSETSTSAIHAARGLVRDAQRIAVLTGAGMSAESGGPTYRDARTGLWEKYSPEQLATPEAMANQPDLVWSWVLYQAQVTRSVVTHDPHSAHGSCRQHLQRTAG